MTVLKAPFVYFGGKAKIAAEVWKRFGDVPNYVESFFGSGAVLLGRPDWRPDVTWIETVNDKSGYISNFWRAVAADPEAVAHYADYPVVESDLHARHVWLLQRKDDLSARLEGDPDYCDPKIAGRWAWGMSCWIGSGFCSGSGPWGWALDEDGNQVLAKMEGGQGVNRQLVHLGDAGRGVNSSGGRSGLTDWMQALSARLRRVRVCCGDWTRVMGPSVTEKNGLSGIFLDPPYSAEAGRDNDLYEQEDATVAHDVRRWCLENGDNPLLRIALAGYSGEGHEELERHGWTALAWKTSGGYGLQGNGNGKANASREVVWFNRHCLPVERRLSLFDLADEDAEAVFA